jgi:hypothetical protein
MHERSHILQVNVPTSIFPFTIQTSNDQMALCASAIPPPPPSQRLGRLALCARCVSVMQRLYLLEFSPTPSQTCVCVCRIERLYPVEYTDMFV